MFYRIFKMSYVRFSLKEICIKESGRQIENAVSYPGRSVIVEGETIPFTTCGVCTPDRVIYAALVAESIRSAFPAEFRK